MEQGVISPDNLSQLLRNISQRRRQGVLEVTLADQQIQILFSTGKVVDALVSTQSSVSHIKQLLLKAGQCSEDQVSDCEDLTQLFKALNQGAAVCEEDRFKQIIRERVLEILYSLSQIHGAYYCFKVQMVETDKNFVSQISVGQLLLDFVAIESEKERFNQTFSDETFVRAEGDLIAGLGTEEAMLLEALADGDYVSNLRVRSLLSSFHFHECMLGLLERGLICISDPAQPSFDDERVGGADHQEHAAKVADEGELAGLEGSIDSLFAEHTNSEVHDSKISSVLEVVAQQQAPIEKQKVIVNAQPSAVQRFNTWMLQESLVADAVVLIALVLGVLAPLFHWTEVLMQF